MRVCTTRNIIIVSRLAITLPSNAYPGLQDFPAIVATEAQVKFAAIKAAECVGKLHKTILCPAQSKSVEKKHR